ncbi:MAG: multiheme c-type cytochrome [Candidatus Acidiferrum sp.]
MKSALLVSCSGAALCFGVSALLAVASSFTAWAQSPQSSSISLPTSLRVRSPGWWPTKGQPSRPEYTGPDACMDCHEDKSETQQDTAMLHAATLAVDSKDLRAHDHLTFQTGPYTYQLNTTAKKSTVTVADASSSLSVDLRWALGSGHMGQTYVNQQNGKLFEGHVSFYTALQALDITPGQSHSVPTSLEAAAGRAIPPDEARLCFGCHTTASTTNDKFDPSSSFLGVTCEACHGPGAQHVAAAAAKTDKRGSGLIFNPDQLSRVESVDFCGACHRTWQDVVSGPMVDAGVFNVRFAPYRLENSRCWTEGDARLTCTSCHDPHKPLSHDVGSYDANCLQCHVASSTDKRTSNRPGAACPVATKNCVTCHMPKVSPPTLHSAFTDHWIRIATPNSSYPE